MRLGETSDVRIAVVHGELADSESLELNNGVIDRLFREDGDQRTGSATLNGLSERLPLFAKESALAHPVVVVDFADVAASVVVKEDDGDGIVGQQVLELAQTLKGGTARIPQQQALAARKFSCGHGAIAICDLFESVNEAKVDVFWQNVFANALCDVAVNLLRVKFAGLVVFFKYGTVGVDAPNLNVGVLFFEVLGDP